MTDIDVDQLGPVDYLVVGFPAEKANFSGEIASELKTLIDDSTIRVLDLVLVMKGDDGSVEASELRDADDSAVGELRALERDLAVSSPSRMSRRSGHRSSPGARLRCWFGRTRGRRRSVPPSAGRAVSCWAAAGSRPRR
jgi:hypothetical protein